MDAKWSSRCTRCGFTIEVGEPIKKYWQPVGIGTNGKMMFKDSGAWIHKDCPKLDKRTGEVVRKVRA